MQVEKNISKLFSKEGIIAYLQNRLSKDEKVMFEKHLQEDAFLKDALEGYKILPAKDLHKHLDAVFADVDMLAGASKKSKLISMQSRPLAIAAMLLVFIGITWFAVWFMNDTSNKQQIAQAEKIYDEGGNEVRENANITSIQNDTLPVDNQQVRIFAQGDSVILDKSVQQTTSENAIAYDEFKNKNQVTAQDGKAEDKTEVNASLAEAPTVVFNEEIPASESKTENDAYNWNTQTGKTGEVVVTDETKRNKKLKKADAEKDVSDGAVDDVASGAPAELAVGTSDSVHNFVEQMPQFTGGDEAMMKFITDNLNIPVSIEGTVFVKFVIDETGKVLNPEILRGLNFKPVDDEVLRVISIMPNWIPGKQNGKNVKVYYTLPLKFTLK